MYKVVNLLEQTVEEVANSVLPTIPGLCPCARCRSDIICLTLNQLSPRYVIHRYGEILSRAEFDQATGRAEIISAVTRAARLIQRSPHQDRPRKVTDRS